MNGKRVPKTRKQFYDLAKKNDCSIDEFIIGGGTYDINVDAPHSYGFSYGELPSIPLNNSWDDDIKTAKQFWTWAYYELESELPYLDKMPKEIYKEIFG